MKKLKEVLLVDDSKGTNSLNKRLLEEMGIAENISTALNGQLALDYLTSKKADGEYPKPDIIFLDINMPVMDGYQFLEEYKEIDEDIKSNHIIVMLTTSISEVDKERTTGYDSVRGFKFKPLTKEKVNEIMNELLQ